MKRWHKFQSGFKVLPKPLLKFACLVPMIILLTVACQSPSKPYAPVENGWRHGDADYHRVKSGDTLYAIAWYYGYDVRELAKMNHLAPPYPIKIGQKIVFTPSSKSPTTKKKKSTTRVAKKKTATQPKASKNSNKLILAKGKWHWPTKGNIVKPYSEQSQTSKGIDIAGKFRQPIYASLSGKVVYSGNGLMGYGNLIIIKHSDDYLSAYAYNAQNLVKEGDNVIRGQKVALMGKPNNKTPRLHFEIRRQGKPVNPSQYIAQH